MHWRQGCLPTHLVEILRQIPLHGTVRAVDDDRRDVSQRILLLAAAWHLEFYLDVNMVFNRQLTMLEHHLAVCGVDRSKDYPLVLQELGEFRAWLDSPIDVVHQTVLAHAQLDDGGLLLPSRRLGELHFHAHHLVPLLPQSVHELADAKHHPLLRVRVDHIEIGAAMGTDSVLVGVLHRSDKERGGLSVWKTMGWDRSRR